MKINCKVQLWKLGLFSCLAFASCQESKVFTPGELWLDDRGVHINAHGGGVLYRDGVYYWYGEHKIGGEAGNVAHVGFHCYSSRDLYSWKDEGIVLSVASEGSGSEIEKGCIMERPKVIYNAGTGKYVMWFHYEPKGVGYAGARSGLATADKPTGPFTFIKTVRPNAGHWPVNYPDSLKTEPVPSAGKRYSGGGLPAHPDALKIVTRDFEGGQMARDMTLFVDDDGKAYHIHASEDNSTLHISLLNDDYLSHSGKYARFFVNRFMEAPAIFKKDGKYYLIMSGCTGWNPNAGRSAVAPSIWGPWTELGNPFIGSDSTVSFHSQSTYILPVQNRKAQFIYLGDRWKPNNAIDGRYIWLPLRFENDKVIIEWKDKWNLREIKN